MQTDFRGRRKWRSVHTFLLIREDYHPYPFLLDFYRFENKRNDLRLDNLNYFSSLGIARNASYFSSYTIVMDGGSMLEIIFRSRIRAFLTM